MNTQDQPNAAEGELRNAIDKLDLSPLAAKLAYHLALDPLGIRREAAPSFAASWTAQPQDACLRAIVELLGRRVIIEVGPDQRLQVDYSCLGISEATKTQILAEKPAFTLHGHPHSIPSMSSLENLFRDEEDPLYVGLQITSPRVFRLLEERAKKNRLTVFLMPRRKDVPHDRQKHYDEVLEEWSQLIRRGPADLKENIRILRVTSASPEIHTSLLSKSVAHLDIYSVANRSTRQGHMIEASAGSSLYLLIERSYKDTVYRSPPMWTLWRCQYLRFFWSRLWIAPIVLLMACCSLLLGGVFFGTIGTLLLGVAANHVYAHLAGITWHPPELFTK